jgi:hypothetical protein
VGWVVLTRGEVHIVVTGLQVARVGLVIQFMAAGRSIVTGLAVVQFLRIGDMSSQDAPLFPMITYGLPADAGRFGPA